MESMEARPQPDYGLNRTRDSNFVIRRGARAPVVPGG